VVVQVVGWQFTFVKSVSESARQPGPVPSMSAFGSSGDWANAETAENNASRGTNFMHKVWRVRVALAMNRSVG